MNPYFCVLPFFGYEYNPKKGTHCCLLPYNYDITTLRSDMLSQRRSEYCQACWKLEDQGLTSDRILKNSALDFYWDKDILNIEELAKNGDYEPIMIKLMVSNKCNSTCITCNQASSTAWGHLYKQNNLTNHIIKTKVPAETINSLNYKNLVGVNFLGGEPFVDPITDFVLEQLIKENNTNCFVSFTTNGSVNFSKKQKLLLEKFKNLNIGVSIDGVGPVFEYIRYPLQWNTLLSNLTFFKEITKNICVNPSISNTNILYFNDLINWLDIEELRFHYNTVVSPAHFKPSALPLTVKEQICNLPNSQIIKCFLGEAHTTNDDINFKQFVEQIKFQDSLKGISMKNYLPEFYELIKDYF